MSLPSLFLLPDYKSGMRDKFVLLCMSSCMLGILSVSLLSSGFCFLMYFFLKNAKL